MRNLRVISAKIPADLFSELEDVRASLRIETRQELIERSLLLFLRSVRAVERPFTEIIQPDQNGSLPGYDGTSDAVEGEMSTVEGTNLTFDSPEGTE